MMKKSNMKIIKRGYCIDLEKIEEGYIYSEYVCVADTKSKAKSELLKMCEYSSMKVKWSDEEVTFLTIPVIRYEHADVVLFQGEQMLRWQAEDLIEKEKHLKELEKISNNSSISHCYIKKRGYYYGDNNGGYVSAKLHAGVYTKEDAISQAKSCLELDIVPIDNKEHNEYLQKHIEKLQNNLLPIHE